MSNEPFGMSVVMVAAGIGIPIMAALNSGLFEGATHMTAYRGVKTVDVARKTAQRLADAARGI